MHLQGEHSSPLCPRGAEHRAGRFRVQTPGGPEAARVKRQRRNSGAARFAFWRTEGAGFPGRTPSCQWTGREDAAGSLLGLRRRA